MWTTLGYIVVAVGVCVILLAKHKIKQAQRYEADLFDHYIDHPDEAPEGYWEAWDEYMDACYPGHR
jgi:hypothetical protein